MQVRDKIVSYCILLHSPKQFAREIMQLFSIGLYQLNPDGTRILSEETGFALETYTIDDIVSYARAWTGFHGRYKRGGTSTSNRQNDGTLDPMHIIAAERDIFPKTNLEGGYIGDQVVPLCADLPEKHFVRKGAVYRLLGSSSRPELMIDGPDWGPHTRRLELDPSSPLFVALCGDTGGGACTFPGKVTLDANLFYDGQTSHAEMNVDTIRTVALKSGLPHPIYYEYVRYVCTSH